MELKLSVSGKSGKGHSLELKGDKAERFLGKRIGEKINGELLGLNGYELEITGGSDSDGFPMKKSVKGTKRVKSFMKEGVGMKKKREGVKKRKFVRGNMISEGIVQLNLKVVKEGDRSISELLGEKTEEEEREEPKEEKEEPEEEEESSKKEGDETTED